MQDCLLPRGVAQILSHDQIVGSAHDAGLLERVRGRSIRSVRNLTKLGLESQLFVALVAIVTAYVGLRDPPIHKVIALHQVFLLQILTVLLLCLDSFPSPR